VLAPDLAYSFRVPKDVSGPTMQLLSRRVTVADTATTVLFTLTGVARDMCLILNNASVRLSPGATQTVEMCVLQGTSAAGLQFDIERTLFHTAATQEEALNWTGAVYLLGGGTDNTIIRVSTRFDAGVNSNQIVVNLHGIIIPRANIAPF